MNKGESRREFLKRMSMAAAGIIAAGGAIRYGAGRAPKSKSAQNKTELLLPRRQLGQTGEQISIFALGGEARIEQLQLLPFGGAEEIINRAIDLGVNYLDTSAYYGHGKSERNIGRILRHRRQEVFLATKSHDRTYDGTMRLAEQSLTNLQTDTIDLYQLHDVRTEEQLDRIFSPNGALKAMETLREQGIVRFIGITGHYDTRILLEAINRYDFDTILLPLNAADIHYNPFQTELLSAALKKNMGVLAMKVLAKGKLLRADGIPSMQEALGYVLSFPVTSAVVGISSVEELEENVEIASTLELPFSTERLASLENLAASSSRAANWYKRQV